MHSVKTKQGERKHQASIIHVMMAPREGGKNDGLRVLLLKIFLQIVLGEPQLRMAGKNRCGQIIAPVSFTKCLLRI